MAFRAPLLGYNTNVRHKGKLYHIQTEDSGVDHPHVITHLFADGGRIVASKKTSYAERVGIEGLQDAVKQLMQGQHKAMFIALRDGIYDEDASDEADEQTGTRSLPASAQQALASSETPLAAPAMQPSPAAAVVASTEVSEPAQARGGPDDDEASESDRPTPPPVLRSPPSAVFKAPKPDARSDKPADKSAAAPRSLFGADLMSDKSLDEVILNYLAANEKDA